MRSISLITILLVSLGATNVLAQSYYVKPGGSDSSDGRSHATAWGSVNKVNSFNFQRGDDVYFLSGGKWLNQKLIVDWSGTDSNRVTIGSYYLSNSGNEIIGVKQGSNKPTFDENWPASGIIITSTDYYTGLIYIKADHVIVQDIQIINSIKNGIQLNGDNKYLVIDRVDTNVTAGAGIRLYGSHSIVRNSTVTEASLGKQIGQWPKGSYPPCIMVSGNSYNIIENNFVYNCYGEGIGFYKKGADYNIARNNVIVGAKALGFYIDRGSYNIAENNIITGTTNKKYWDNDYNSGPGMGVNTEKSGSQMVDAIGNIFRNNLVAFTKSCLWVGQMPGVAEPKRSGVEFIGNTCVANETSISGNASGDRVEKVIVKNNIFYQTAQPSSCFATDTGAYIFDNNLWGATQTKSICHGSNDVIGDASLSKATNWKSLDYKNIPNTSDFTPKSTSIAIGKGRIYSQLTHDFHNKARPNLSTLGAIEVNPTTNDLDVPTGLSFSVITQ